MSILRDRLRARCNSMKDDMFCEKHIDIWKRWVELMSVDGNCLNACNNVNFDHNMCPFCPLHYNHKQTCLKSKVMLEAKKLLIEMALEKEFYEQ